jgi:threonine dehydrogenase-like Zn-dependent dehydrogenase
VKKVRTVADHRALVIAEPGVIALEDVPPLVPGPGEVVARPAYVGVCGTDLELLDGVVDPAYVRYPLVPGHEWSGVIEAVGPGVTTLTPGQPVIAEGIIPDRVCAQCVRGNTNLCLTYDEIGFTRAGAAADQLLLPAQVVHPLAARSMVSAGGTWARGASAGGASAGSASAGSASAGRASPLADAALAEPAAVAWRGISRGQPRPGERIAVVGDGTVGLITAHLLGLYSPADLVVFGQRADQAGLAAELGATAFELAGPAETPAQFDLVIEAAGKPAAVEDAIALARRGGRVVLLGLAGTGVKAGLPIDDVVNNDLSITASFGYTSAAWAEVAGLLRAGKIHLSPLITHRFPLEAFPDAYRTLREGTGPRGKVLLEINP